MDCCICSPMQPIFRPPRNTLCQSCYEGAKSMVALLDDVEGNKGDGNNTKPRHRLVSQPKGMSNVFKWMKEIKDREERLEEKAEFLGGLVVALEEEMHTDIVLKAGTGPPIATHKALLATRSEIFRNMLSSDECKAQASDTISLPDLSHEELSCLLEFLYRGSLDEDEADKHCKYLLVIADKYDIPFLKKFCEQWLLKSLDLSNALDMLEASNLCSTSVLKEQSVGLIVKHMENFVFSEKYEEFALKNAHLSLEVTRALLMEMKEKSGENSH